MEGILDMVQTLIAVLVAITLHEFAHGYVSYKMGDPTPKQMGRLSLNPFKHLDFLGTICLMVVHFGWAKPVQVNPYYYKNR
ncbi:MAG: site-2 protease family protein, partial [Niameybacter sp.]